MKIIVEGPDGSGKSTLVNELISRFGDLALIMGKGPETYRGEMAIRAIEYIKLIDDPGSMIFDRHPCISHPVYSQFTPVSRLPRTVINQFYCRLGKLFIIICKGQPILNQTLKGYDTEDHVSALHRNHDAICHQYDLYGSILADFQFDYLLHNVDDVINAMGARTL